MTTATHKQLMQDIFAELSQGNSKPFVDAMADGFRWTIPGTTPWSRTYDGKQAVLAELLAPLRAQMAERMKTTAHHVMAEGDRVVVEARGSNITRAGRRYGNSYCFVFRLAEGKLQEVTEYMDTQLLMTALEPPAAG